MSQQKLFLDEVLALGGKISRLRFQGTDAKIKSAQLIYQKNELYQQFDLLKQKYPQTFARLPIEILRYLVAQHSLQYPPDSWDIERFGENFDLAAQNSDVNEELPWLAEFIREEKKSRMDTRP